LGHKISTGETLTLNDKAVKILDNQLTVVFHKPIGIVSGTPEGDQIPAVRLITRETLHGRTHAIPGRQNSFAPLGRLDMDSRGLLILSEDGVLAKAIIGPDAEMEKEYLVKVRGEITDEALTLLRHGLELDERQLRPAIVEKVGAYQMRFILREGRNRQIRRMCDLVGLRVTDLNRIRIGALKIEDLPEGKWRPLQAREREALVRGMSNVPAGKKDAGARSDGTTDRPRRTFQKPRPKERTAIGSSVGSEPGQNAAYKRFRDPMKPKVRTKLKPRKRTPIK
jgi:23S rRNA pseudouridine2604 synthase